MGEQAGLAAAATAKTIVAATNSTIVLGGKEKELSPMVRRHKIHKSVCV